jgi:hypothetical protein
MIAFKQAFQVEERFPGRGAQTKARIRWPVGDTGPCCKRQESSSECPSFYGLSITNYVSLVVTFNYAIEVAIARVITLIGQDGDRNKHCEDNRFSYRS